MRLVAPFGGPEELLQHGLAGRDALDRVRAAKQFIEQKQVRRQLIARPNQCQQRFDLDEVVALAGEEISVLPMQLRTWNMGARSQREASGTVCARTALTPTVRRNVDFPDMLEPVTSTPRPGCTASEFGTASIHERVT